MDLVWFDDSSWPHNDGFKEEQFQIFPDDLHLLLTEDETPSPKTAKVAAPKGVSPNQVPRQLSDDELLVEEKNMEGLTLTSRHKHRKGLTCPRCKFDQRLKQIRRVIHRRCIANLEERNSFVKLNHSKGRHV